MRYMDDNTTVEDNLGGSSGLVVARYSRDTVTNNGNLINRVVRIGDAAFSNDHILLLLVLRLPGSITSIRGCCF